MDAKGMVTELRKHMAAEEIRRAIGCSIVAVYSWQHYGGWPSRKYADKLKRLYEQKAGDENPRK